MKSIEFNEDQMKNLNIIAQELFDDKSDPRSISYDRILVRPKINWLGIMLWFFIPAICIFILLNEHIFKIDMTARICLITVFILVYIILTLKRTVICIVELYQRFAPESVRLKCRFEPSCSQYMILAIQKYGVVKGMQKGIDRLKRCNINGGGYDEP